jgi:hypothetical protein
MRNLSLLVTEWCLLILIAVSPVLVPRFGPSEMRRFGWRQQTGTPKRRQTITPQYNPINGIRVFTLICSSRIWWCQGIPNDVFQIPTEKSSNQPFLLRRACPSVAIHTRTRTWLEICCLQTFEPRRDSKSRPWLGKQGAGGLVSGALCSHTAVRCNWGWACIMSNSYTLNRYISLFEIVLPLLLYQIAAFVLCNFVLIFL